MGRGRGEEVRFLLALLLLFLLVGWILPGVSFFLDRYRVPVVLVLSGTLAVARVNWSGNEPTSFRV